jgi:hypothetical protein
MNNAFLTTSIIKESKVGESGYKVIEMNVSDSTENLYAVVTPINKMQ